MAKFTCKMCGSDMFVNDNMTVEICERCGSTMTLPRTKSEIKVNLYNDANKFRSNGEFGKAMDIYASILDNEPTDAEAHWNMVLCKYGVLYTEDRSRKRVPTCSKMCSTAVSEDENYKDAIQNADVLAKAVYEEEAKKIDELQKNMIKIAEAQEPFDVYISYQETDQNGRRTSDSLLANDMYKELTSEGYKVFYSRVTLEDKSSEEYEPYIYAALKSAKVMITMATRPEYFHGADMRSEWSRYIEMIENGDEKLLIPAYKDMDIDELPRDLMEYQSQDMSSMKFLLNVLKSVSKMCAPAPAPQAAPTPAPAPAPQPTPAPAPTPAATPQAAPTPAPAPAPKRPAPSSDAPEIPVVRRAFSSLKNADWDEADDLLDQVLATDPTNAKAYIGKLMIDMRIKNESDLGTQNKTFNTDPNFQKALQYADDKYREKLEKYVNEVNATMKANGLKYLKMIRDNKKQKAEIQSQISAMENEEASLNKLQFGRKKKLQEQIADLKKQLEELNIDLTMNGKIGALSPGYLVNFGHYNNKKIVWRVIKVEFDRVMFVAEDCIASREYNDNARDCFWELSPLRKWLNSEFFANAFNSAEKDAILPTHLSNPNNPQYDITGGNDTDDKVFLLSLDEANEIFETNDDRIALNEVGNRTKWWLRSPGISNKFAACIDDDGAVNVKGDTNTTDDGVRPVVCTNMNIMKIING